MRGWRIGLVLGILLVGCQTEEGNFGKSAAAIRAEREQCAVDGGKYLPGGIVGYVCYLPAPDAGKSCNRESDCSGLCMAEERTCSLFSPVFGCQLVLTDEGKQVEICFD